MRCVLNARVENGEVEEGDEVRVGTRYWAETSSTRDLTHRSA